MKINNNELKKIISIAGQGVLKSSTTDEFKCIKLSVSNNLAGIIAASSQQNIIQIAQVQSEDDEKWEALINYALISSLVSKFQGDTTEIIKKEDKIILKNSRSKTEISILSKEMPMLIIGEKKEIMEISKEEWLKFFKPVTYAIAADDSRPILQCVCLSNTDGINTDIVALDGYRVSKTTIQKNNKIDCIIDGETIKNISEIINKLEDNVTIKFFMSDSKLIFTINTCSIISTVISGDYIAYRKIIPETSEMSSLILNREELLHSLDRLKISQKNVPVVKFNINENKLELTSNSEIAKINEELTVVSNLSDFCIAFNINYLIDSLKQFNEEKITLYFTTNLDPCVIKNDYMVAMILPVRAFA